MQCPVCNAHSESISHLLWECPHSVSFRNRLSPPSGLISSFSLPISDWLQANCTSKQTSWHHRIPWHLLFLFGIWSIWLNRNKVAVQSSESNPPPVEDCIAKALEHHFLTSPSICQKLEPTAIVSTPLWAGSN